MIPIDSLYGLEDRRLGGCELRQRARRSSDYRPFEGRTYRLDHAVLNAFVFHDRQWSILSTVASNQARPTHFQFRSHKYTSKARQREPAGRRLDSKPSAGL
jgi:hypothetical protein